MGLSNIASIYSYKNKRIGFVYFIVFVIIKAIAIYTNSIGDPNMRVIDGMMVLSLMIIVFSKERIDDERTKQVRYFSLKITFQGLLGIIVFMNMDNYESNFTYIPIIALLFYLVVFKLSNYFSPSYIFKENEKSNKISEGIVLIIMTLLALVFSINIISTLI